MTKLIVGFGEALVDVLPSGEVVGGAPLNFSVRAAELCKPLGWQAALVTRIGSDGRGERILAELTRSGVDITAIQVDASQPSGFVDVTLDNGHPSYEIGQNVAWDHISFEAQVADVARQASAVCFGTLAQRYSETAQTLEQFLSAASASIRIFDINLRKPFPNAELIERSLRNASILKCNEEELLLLNQWLELQQPDDPVQVAQALQLRFDLDCVLWTRGSDGCVLQRGLQCIESTVPDLPCEPDADSVGAGDAASAALAFGLVSNWEDDRVVRLANYLGAFAASQRGATSPLPEQLLSDISRIDL